MVTRMMRKIGLWTAIVALGLAVGCGDTGGGSSGAAGPSPSQKTSAQTTDAGGQAVEQAAEFSTDALVESGSPGSTSSKTGQTASSTAGGSINFQATVTLTVDLDAPGGSGTDAHPNASGVFEVTATGTVLGDSMNGEVTYAVDVTWLTNGVFTDPVCGAQATVTAGSHVNYTARIQWAKTDDMNWSIQATYDVNGAASGTVTHDGHLWNVTGTVTVHASASFSRSAGTYSFTFGITGQKVVVVDDGAEVHTVAITMEALDRIFIDVDGVRFGPFTAAQVWWIFHFDCRG